MLATQSTSKQQRIGRYEVLRKIATGGMAELFLAKQVGMEGFEKVVAIKRILAHLAYDEEFINMFRDEARIVAKLSHPNIVQIYDLGKSNDSYFIAMEYIPGRNLSSVAKKARAAGEKLPPQYIGRCVAQACEGLYYAHTRKDIDGRPLQIVHRDISPQNIIVSFSGAVKLVDFGIAKAATKIAHTRAGVLKGKYAYMSPEQIRGEEIDARSDLFATGIVLYELLCGRRPFEKDNSIQTLKAIVQDQHRDCRELNPDIPDTLAEIIDCALSKNPGDRYQNAQEMQVALEDFVSASPVRVNNIAISQWITKLFQDELSKEQGGTVIFQGVGEVILPDVQEEADQPASNPRGDELTNDVRGREAEPLPRGRGGGSVEHSPVHGTPVANRIGNAGTKGLRPPIQAPSNSMVQRRGQSVVDPARQSLIEEGVIDRPVRQTPEGGYDDDATVHSPDPGPPNPAGRVHNPPSPAEEMELPASARALRGTDRHEDNTVQPSLPPTRPPSPERPVYEEQSLDRPLKPELYDDGKTEFAGDPPAAAQPSEDVAMVLEPDDFEPFEEEGSEAADPWNEATVGYPDGQPPTGEESENDTAALPAIDRIAHEAVVDDPDVLDDAGVWSELSDNFDNSMAGEGFDDDAWGDRTAANGTYMTGELAPEPVIQEGEFFEQDDDPFASDDPIDATISNAALGDSGVFEADATISAASIDSLEPETHPPGRRPARRNRRTAFDEEATIGEEAHLERGMAQDREDSGMDDAALWGDNPTLGGTSDDPWGGDATIAGGDAIGWDDDSQEGSDDWNADATIAGAPSIEGLDEQTDEARASELEAILPNERIRGEASGLQDPASAPDLLPEDLELDVMPELEPDEWTVSPMDDEPELPPSAAANAGKALDDDAATVAGVTSDYIAAQVSPERHGGYDALANVDINPGPTHAPAGAHSPSAHLGAIKLGKVQAAPSGGVIESGSFGMGAVGQPEEEATEGGIPAYNPSTPAFEPAARAPSPRKPEPIEPVALEFEDASIEEQHLPSAVVSSSALHRDRPEVSIQDEYDALVGPSKIKPLNPASNQSIMGIGSTNVPPANLSLSEMLSNPLPSAKVPRPLTQAPEAPAGMGAPQRATPSMRSASLIGRQIREVVHQEQRATGSGVTPDPQQAAPAEQAPMAATGSLAHMMGGQPGALPGPPGQAAYGQMPPQMVAPQPPNTKRRWVLLLVLIALGVSLMAVAAYYVMPMLKNKEPHLTIRTTPSGAKVYVNGQPQPRVTPMRLKGLNPGVTYKVRLELEGYESFTQAVQMPKERPLLMNRLLVKTAGAPPTPPQ